MTAELRAEPGTGHEVAVYGGPGGGVKLSGVASDLSVEAFGGNASWLGYAMIAGRWYRAPGEVDVNTSFLTASGLTVGDTATVDILGLPGRHRDYGADRRGGVRAVQQPLAAGQHADAARPGHAQDLQGYDVGLRAGTSAPAYLHAVNQALGRGNPWRAMRVPGSPFYEIATALISLLALMVAVAAALGVLNTVLMTTRDRVHDLGIFKAIGMRPSQLLTMVVCWIAGPAVVAAVIAAPAAVALTTATMHAMAGTVHTGLPASFTQVFGPGRLALLSLGALAIALAGALLPAVWAARTRPATALRAE